MNIVDCIIVIELVIGVALGEAVGFVRQLGYSIGILWGLYVGSWVDSRLIFAANTSRSRAALAFVLVVLITFLVTDICAYIGTAIWHHAKRIDRIVVLNKGLGMIFGGLTVVVIAWYASPTIGSSPFTPIAVQVQTSHIITVLDDIMPSQPQVMLQIGNLLQPFNQPRIFANGHYTTSASVQYSAKQQLQWAVQQDQDAVVRVMGTACNFTSQGTGFYVGDDLVATNAHVVAGVIGPIIQDSTGKHLTEPIVYDPELDFALLRVYGGDSQPIALDTRFKSATTPVAVISYTGSTRQASISNIIELTAVRGYDIYSQNKVTRDIYVINANIQPGNSGSPLIEENGDAAGIVFGNSLSQKDIGYALAMRAVSQDITPVAMNSSHPAYEVNTGKCTD